MVKGMDSRGFAAGHLIFILVFIGLKITSLVISSDHSDAECYSNASVEPVGYLDSCRSNAACYQGYICSTDQLCYCDTNKSNVPIVNPTACTTNSECPSRQVCSIETLQCVYPDVCKYDAASFENYDGLSLASWLMIYGIVGMVVGIIALIFVLCRFGCCGQDNCYGGICIIGTTWTIGIIYLIFSLGWNWFGWYLLYDPQYSCKDTYPTLWNFSVANCVLLYVFIVFNPITATFASEKWGK